MAKFSKESFIKSGKIQAEVEIELPMVDGNGKLYMQKGSVTIKPLSNRKAEMLNTIHKDDPNGLAKAMVDESIPELQFSEEEFKQLGNGTIGTLLGKINEVSGLDKGYLQAKNF